MGGDLWASFPVDPRQRAHAGIRASDDDRERITAVLTESFADGRIEREELDERMARASAARTLGELPPLVADLVPLHPPAPRGGRSLVGVPPEELRERAVERWADRRRGAAFVFLGSTILAWGLVAATGNALGWVLVVFNALALLNLGRVLMSREQIVRDEERRLQRRQARQQRWPRALPPGPWGQL